MLGVFFSIGIGLCRLAPGCTDPAMLEGSLVGAENYHHSAIEQDGDNGKFGAQLCNSAAV